MKQTNTILLVVVLAIALAVLGLWVLKSEQSVKKEATVVGATLVTPSTYYGATNSSSTVPATATTTNPILSLDANRTNALICNISATSTVYLHQSAISSTTGVTVNTGVPIFPTSTQAQVCQQLPGFKGYLFGICGGTSCTVTVSSWK